MCEEAKFALVLAKAVQAAGPRAATPPEEGANPRSEQVLSHSIVRGTRTYLERIVYQINGTYEHGWFDACAVMIRRLLETLIIEVFEHHGKATDIQNPQGDFLHLRDLVARTLSEQTWNLGRNTKAALPRLKDIGDKSAHSRRFLAHRTDIQAVTPDLRVVVQELVLLAKLK
jgi:hypothetical protein